MLCHLSCDVIWWRLSKVVLAICTPQGEFNPTNQPSHNDEELMPKGRTTSEAASTDVKTKEILRSCPCKKSKSNQIWHRPLYLSSIFFQCINKQVILQCSMYIFLIESTDVLYHMYHYCKWNYLYQNMKVKPYHPALVQMLRSFSPTTWTTIPTRHYDENKKSTMIS